MKDKDTKILEEAYENIFAGVVEDSDEEEKESEDKEMIEDKPESDDSEKSDDDSNDSDDSDDSDDDSKDDSSDDSDTSFKFGSDDDDDDDSDEEPDGDEDGGEADGDHEEPDGDELSDEAGGDAGIQSKVKQLQKQYNDVLVDAFDKYAADCIQDALDETESAFGEDIETILDSALDKLKGKILGDLGVESSPDGMEMAFGGEVEQPSMDLEPDDSPEDGSDDGISVPIGGSASPDILSKMQDL